ncbi:MAG: hypothetical protein WAN86_22540 [Hyphomicrobiaceae bacterium]
MPDVAWKMILLRQDRRTQEVRCDETRMPAEGTEAHATQARLCQAAGELRHAMPELQRQRERKQEARADLSHCTARRADTRIEAEQADERLAVLREAIGATGSGSCSASCRRRAAM